MAGVDFSLSAMSKGIREEHRIPPEMVPISGMNPYFQYVSSARQVMFTGNLAQANVLMGRTRKRQRSGLEREHAKATFKHQFKRDAYILDIIPRFSDMGLNEKFAINPLDVVIFEDYETRQMDVMELSKFHVMHQHYGFRYKFNEEVYNDLRPRARVKAGTVVANSPNVTDDGDYMIGLETNVCMISDPSVTEDGVAYSRSYANRIVTTGYESRVFSCGRTHYPINAYGNAETFKAIPDIGDKILSNGLVAALRPFDPYLDAIYMSRNKLFKPVYGMDTPYIGMDGATVVDIRVLHNDQFDGAPLPEEMSAQFRKYYEADKRFYMQIIKTCLMRSGRNYLSEDVNLSPRLWALIYEAICRCGDDLVKEGLWPKDDVARLRAQKNYRGETMDEWIVEVIYEYTTNMGEGPKVTDIHGGKGVGVAVWEDEDMPVDDFGNRAEVAIFHGSTVNRMNTGRTHEQALGATGRDVIKRIRRSYGFPDMGPIQDAEVRDAVYGNEKVSRNNFDYLLGAYKILSPSDIYPKLAKEEVRKSERWAEHLIQVIHDGDEPYGLYIQNTSDSDLRVDQALLEIEHGYDGAYMPEMSPVTYRNSAGEIVRTKSNVLIGPNYYLALEKTATDWSGVSSSKVNHFGTTARLTNADKYSSPGRQTVTRSIGESEARNLAAAMGAEPVAHIMDLNNNPPAHREVCRTILTHPTPTNIEQLVDRKKFKLGGHRPLAYAIHQLACSGKTISRE